MKHWPAAHVFYISLVFSNTRRVLSQCKTRFRLLYLLNKLDLNLYNLNKLNYKLSSYIWIGVYLFVCFIVFAFMNEYLYKILMYKTRRPGKPITGWQTCRWHHWFFFSVSLSHKTDRFRAAVHLFSSGPQKNMVWKSRVSQSTDGSFVTDVLTTFWRRSCSIPEKTHNNEES